MTNLKKWSKDELILAFYQYCITPFGKIHNRNPEILKLAKMIGRTPSALAMKMCNFASFDPIHQKRNVKGLSNVAKSDKTIWEEFNNNWDELLLAYHKAIAHYDIQLQKEQGDDNNENKIKLLPTTEVIKETKIRTAQSFFRNSVLANYNYRCAFCEIDNIKLLNAGHIIPWSVDEARRADPTNGLSLCAIHDRAFDRGLLTLDEDYRIVLSDQMKKTKTIPKIYQVAFLDIAGEQMLFPDKFIPSQIVLEYHRNNIFEKN